jgi:hypothetical protein
MTPKPWSSRVALWVAVFALLLKGAVPMFAALAADIRGVSAAEICPVYGVALPKPRAHDLHAEHAHQAGMAGHAGPNDHSSHDRGAHVHDHCALTALVAFATHDPQPLSLPVHQAIGFAQLSQALAWAPRIVWNAAQPRAPPSV